MDLEMAPRSRRNRWFVVSPLEGTGFEPSVPGKNLSDDRVCVTRRWRAGGSHSASTSAAGPRHCVRQSRRPSFGRPVRRAACLASRRCRAGRVTRVLRNLTSAIEGLTALQQPVRCGGECILPFSERRCRYKHQDALARTDGLEGVCNFTAPPARYRNWDRVWRQALRAFCADLSDAILLTSE